MYLSLRGQEIYEEHGINNKGGAGNEGRRVQDITIGGG